MLPRLTQARAPLTCAVQAINEHGQTEDLAIPAERALTVYVDKRELVTLMTLGAHPEWLVLGYLRNQRLVDGLAAVESITVDWDAGEGGAGVAAVKTHHGIADLSAKTAQRVVTTGCGQGSMFGDLLTDIDGLQLPPARLSQQRLYAMVEAIRVKESTYKSAGSVHACALFQDGAMRLFVEDVGRHNAIDTIAGWMWMQGIEPGLAPIDAPWAFYTTGRLTSEMVLKAAQMRVPVVVSRSGITQMGHEMAHRLGLCTVGRATHKRFLCYTAPQVLQWQPELAQTSVKKVGP